jgi:hypothetical protein
MTEAHFIIACLEKGRDIPMASEKETHMPLLLSALISYTAVCLRWYSEVPSPCRTKPCGFWRDFHGPVHNELTPCRITLHVWTSLHNRCFGGNYHFHLQDERTESIFWDAMPCRIIPHVWTSLHNQRFGGSYRFHLQQYHLLGYDVM